VKLGSLRPTSLRQLLDPATLRRMAKPNYQQARKQRELARKSRQQQKQQRRSARAGPAAAGSKVEPVADAGTATRGTPIAGRE